MNCLVCGTLLPPREVIGTRLILSHPHGRPWRRVRAVVPRYAPGAPRRLCSDRCAKRREYQQTFKRDAA